MQVTYHAEKCPCCGQSLTYVIPIDKGTTEILKAMIRAIKNKGKNEIHPRNEMEIHNDFDSILSSIQTGNLSRPRFHGLIAKIKERPGYYCITNKGVSFLKGQSVPKYAIVSKKTARNIGYYEEEKYQVTIKDFLNSDERWEFPDVEIRGGEVPEKSTNLTQNRLFSAPYNNF
jgi:hypothetical protein